MLSDHHKARIGCVVVKGHKIISSGHNSDTKCNSVQAKADTERYGKPCCGKEHAESAALVSFIKAGEDLTGATVYVYRKLKDETPAMARPCPSCEAMIRSLGIRRVKYSTNNGFATEIYD